MRGFHRAAVAASAGLALLGSAVVAANSAATARASVVPGRNGKIVVGPLFPKFGFTINPNGSQRQGVVQCLGPEPCSARYRKSRRVPLPPVEPNSQVGSLLRLVVTDWTAAVVPQRGNAEPGAGGSLLDQSSGRAASRAHHGLATWLFRRRVRLLPQRLSRLVRKIRLQRARRALLGA